MNLIQAFSFSKKDCISFIGSVGKTAAMFQIARQYQCPVLVTTTTYIGATVAELADHHIVLDEIKQFNSNKLSRSTGVTLITGPRTPDDKYSSPTLPDLDEIYKYSQNHEFPLLIVADSFQEKPLKAHGDNVPDIPSYSTCIVTLFGLSGIGNQFGDAWVSRPEKFAELSGITEGKITTADSLFKVLSSKNGGLRSTQDGVKRYLIINQADDMHLQAIAGKLANDLLPIYEKIVIFQSNPEQQLLARKKPIAAIILAAGGSSRFGKAKQLISWRKKSYTENVVIAAQQAGLSPIIVVVGHQHEVLKDKLRLFPVQTVYNPNWKQGQSTSMKAGLENLEGHTQGVIFLMADQPQVSIRLIRALMEQAYLTDRQIIGPMIDGKRSTPMFYDKSVFPELMKVVGDQGGRSILSTHPPMFIEWFDTRMGLDIDFDVDIKQLTKME